MARNGSPQQGEIEVSTSGARLKLSIGPSEPLIVGLVLAAFAWLGQLQIIPDEKAQLPPGLMLLLAATLCVAFSLTWFWNRRRNRSTFVRPPGRISDHFVGREDDVRDLVRELKTSPLVWLVGESGVGKSTLLSKGILSALEDDDELMPFYLDTWGLDWIQHPQETVCQRLSQALRNRQPSLEPDAHAQETSQPLADLVEFFSQRTGRVPVLIFDQFDNYVKANKKKFCPRRKYISVKRLRKKNPFWDVTADLIGQGKLRCLFAVRKDMQEGLNSVRFVEVEPFLLRRLPAGSALTLLDRITEGGIIRHPENGWTELKGRLSRDLEANGLLPIQMKLVIEGIKHLDALILSEYLQKGELQGLEAEHLGAVLNEISRQCDCEILELRNLLFQMIDRDGDARSTKVHLGDLPVGDLEEKSLRCALQLLIRAEIVRERTEPGCSQPLWQLDHDYLAHSVLELERRASPALHLLNESEQAYQAATGLRASWKTLLSPWDQLRIVIQRIRGRVRYGRHALYAFASTARLLVNWAVLAGVLGMYAWHEVDTATRADFLFSFIGLDDKMSQDEIDALYQVARSPESVRVKVLQSVFDSPPKSRRFSSRDLIGRGRISGKVIQAVVGLNSRTRRRVKASIIFPECYAEIPTDPPIVDSCIDLILALERKSDQAAIFLISAMELENDSSRLSSLAKALGSLGDKLDTDSATTAAKLLVTAMEREENSLYHLYLERALQLLVRKLDIGTTATLAEKLIAVMERKQDSLRLPEVGTTFRSLGGNLDPDSAAKVGEQLVEAMERKQDTSRLSSLGSALGSLGSNLNSGSAAKGARLLVEAMERERDTSRLSSLGSALGSLRPNLDPGSVAKGARLLVEAMERERDTSRLSSLGSALGSLGSNLDPVSAARGAKLLVAAMGREKGSLRMTQLGRALASLGDKLDPQLAATGAEVLVATMEQDRRALRRAQLGVVLGSLRSRLDPGSITKFAARLVAAIKLGKNGSGLATLERTLGSLGRNLDPESVANAVERLVATMEREESSSRLLALGNELASLKSEIDPRSTERALERLVLAMEREEDSSLLVSLGGTLGRLGKKLKSVDRRVVEVWLKRMGELSSPPCASMAPLVGQERLQHVIDVLKWPFCSDSHRSALIRRFAELTGIPESTFGSTDEDGKFKADLWAFVDWAEKQGYDLSSDGDSWLDWLHPWWLWELVGCN